MTANSVSKKWAGLPPSLAGYLDLCAHAANFSLCPGGFGDAVVKFSGRRVSDDLAARLYGEFAAFVADPSAFRKRRRSAIDVMLDDVKVATTLELQHDGRIEHRHTYSTPTDEAIVGLCLALLCDPRFPPDEVRLCKLDSCRRVFRRLGSKRRYCSDGCTEKADHIFAVDRNREKRRRDADALVVRTSSRKPK